MKKTLRPFLFIAAAIAASCAPKPVIGPDGHPVRPTLRIYTSMYPEVIAALKPLVAAKVAAVAPDTTVEWTQGGSERLAKKLDAELKQPAGSKVDLLLTSDPSYYRALATRGALVAYESPEAARIPAALASPDHLFTTARLSSMVIGVSAEAPKSAIPSSFQDLASLKPSTKIAIGDPDFSGTNLLTAARLSTRYGWDYYSSLAAKKALVAGSNSTVMLRLETATSDVAIVLLENLLASRAKGNKVSVVYPKDGAIVVPGPIALLSHAKDSKAARAAYDALLSADGQKILVETGFMHSPDPAMHPPADAPALSALMGSAKLESVYEPIADREDVQKKFAKLFAR